MKIKTVKYGSLILLIENFDDRTILEWNGESNDKRPSEMLMPFFKNFIKRLDKILVIKFDKLEYMNSSTIHPLILFIKKLNEKNIKTDIIYNKNSKWQKVSFEAMKNLTKVLKNITVQAI